MATYGEARGAKAVAQKFLQDAYDVNGVGIAILANGEYGVKVNLAYETDLALPSHICGGVPVVLEVVGQVKAT